MIRNLVISGLKPMEMNLFSENDRRISIIKKAIERRLRQFLEEGLEWILLSGQMGVELWTAEVALQLKEEYDLRVAMIPPFENFSSRWPETLQYKFEELSFTVDFFEPLYRGDYRGPFQFRARDEWLIDKSDACLLLMDEDHPGSVGYFYNVAQRAKDYPIYLITPLEIEDVVREMEMEDPTYWEGDTHI